MNILAEISAFTIVMIFVGIILLVLLIIMAQFIGLYVRAAVSGAHVGFVDLFGMRLRRVNAMAIVNARIQATRAGLAVSREAERAAQDHD